MGFAARIWHHRGYRLTIKQKRVINCVWLVEGCNMWLPREFLWDSGNKEECQHYIDLIAAKKMVEAKLIEETGIIKEAVYDTTEQGRKRIVKLNPVRLMAIVRGEEFLEIPVDCRVHITDRRMSMHDIDAALFSDELTAEYVRQLRALNGNRPVIAAAISENMKKYGVDTHAENQHTGCNLALTDAAPVRASQPEDVPPEPSEIPISATDHNTYTETVSLLTIEGKAPYFVRRLIRDRYLLWSGTSFHANGPWTRYYIDPSRLAALGITP